MLYWVPGDPNLGTTWAPGTGRTVGTYVGTRVRYAYETGTVRVRYVGTVRRYVVLVQCTHRTCFLKMWCYF